VATEHSRAEIIAKHGSLHYKLETSKQRLCRGGAVISRLYELVEDKQGFLSWMPFGGWSAVLATGGNRATEKAINGCHERALLVAQQAVEERRAYLHAVTEHDERPTHCAQCAEERGVACPAPGTCTHEEGANQ
jgi:hypothetical protein